MPPPPPSADYYKSLTVDDDEEDELASNNGDSDDPSGATYEEFCGYMKLPVSGKSVDEWLDHFADPKGVCTNCAKSTTPCVRKSPGFRCVRCRELESCNCSFADEYRRWLFVEKRNWCSGKAFDHYITKYNQKRANHKAIATKRQHAARYAKRSTDRRASTSTTPQPIKPRAPVTHPYTRRASGTEGSSEVNAIYNQYRPDNNHQPYYSPPFYPPGTGPSFVRGPELPMFSYPGPTLQPYYSDSNTRPSLPPLRNQVGEYLRKK